MTDNADARPAPAAAPIAPPAAGISAFAPQAPAAIPRRSRRRLVLLTVAVVGGVGSLILVAATRSPVASQAAQAALTPPSKTRIVTAAASTDHATPNAAEPLESAPIPHWVASGLSRRQYGAGATLFELAADDNIDVWHNRVRPVLTVRCAAKAAEVFVMTYSPSAFESDADRRSVQVSFDDGDPADLMWEFSQAQDALFAPDGHALLPHIAGARKMSFTFTPFNALPATARFSVSGFDTQLKSAAKICGWKP